VITTDGTSDINAGLPTVLDWQTIVVIILYLLYLYPPAVLRRKRKRE